MARTTIPDYPLYLSGPMSGIAQNNIPAFEDAATKLRAKGYIIVGAHEIPHGGKRKERKVIEPQVPRYYTWQDFLADDLVVMIKQTQGIMLLPGWPSSEGAKLELHVNVSLKRPVFYYRQGKAVAAQ